MLGDTTKGGSAQTQKTTGPTPPEVAGKYVVVWEKVGNEWKFAADIWNDGK